MSIFSRKKKAEDEEVIVEDIVEEAPVEIAEPEVEEAPVEAPAIEASAAEQRAIEVINRKTMPDSYTVASGIWPELFPKEYVEEVYATKREPNVFEQKHKESVDSAMAELSNMTPVDGGSDFMTPSLSMPEGFSENLQSSPAVDTIISFAEGITSIVESGLGLVDTFAYMTSLGKAKPSSLVQPIIDKAKAGMFDMRSDAYKFDQTELNAIDTITGKISYIVSNPEMLMDKIAGNLPMSYAAGAIGGGLSPVLKGVGVASQAAPVVGAAVGEGLLSAGSTAYDFSSNEGLDLGSIATSLNVGMATTLISLGSSSLQRRLVGVDFESSIAGATARQSLVKNPLVGVILSGTMEAVLEEIPQTLVETVLPNIERGEPWDDGLKEGIADSIVVGFAMGAGAKAQNVMSEASAASKSDRLRQTYGLSEAQWGSVTEASSKGDGSAKELLNSFIIENRKRTNRFAGLIGEDTSPSIWAPSYDPSPKTPQESAKGLLDIQDAGFNSERETSASAIGDGTRTAKDVFDSLIQDQGVSKSTKDMLNGLFTQFGDSIGGLRVVTTDEDMGDRVAKISKDGTIAFSASAVEKGLLTETTANTLLHEVTHGATQNLLRSAGIPMGKDIASWKDSLASSLESGAVSDKQSAAINGLISAYELASPVIKGEYGSESLYEFAAEALSSETMQSKLKAIKVEGKTVWDKIVQYLADFFGFDARSNLLDSSIGKVFDIAANNEAAKAELVGLNPLLAEKIQAGDSHAAALADKSWLNIASQSEIKDVSNRVFGFNETAKSIAAEVIAAKQDLYAKPQRAIEIRDRIFGIDPMNYSDPRALQNARDWADRHLNMSNEEQRHYAQKSWFAIKDVVGTAMADEYVSSFGLSSPKFTPKQQEAWARAQAQAFGGDAKMFEGASPILPVGQLSNKDRKILREMEALGGDPAAIEDFWKRVDVGRMAEKDLLDLAPDLISNTTMSTTEMQRTIDQRNALMKSMKTVSPQKLSNKDRKMLRRLDALGNDLETIEDFWNDEDVRRIFEKRSEADRLAKERETRYYVDREVKLDPTNPKNLEALAYYYAEEAGLPFDEAAKYVAKSSKSQRAEFLRIINGEPQQRARRQFIDQNIYGAYDYLRTTDFSQKSDDVLRMIGEMRMNIESAEQQGVSLRTSDQMKKFFLEKGISGALSAAEEMMIASVEATDGVDFTRRANGIMAARKLPPVFSKQDLDSRIPKNLDYAKLVIRESGMEKMHASAMINGLDKVYEAFKENGGAMPKAGDGISANMLKYFDALIYAEDENSAVAALNGVRESLKKGMIVDRVAPVAELGLEAGVGIVIKESPAYASKKAELNAELVSMGIVYDDSTEETKAQEPLAPVKSSSDMKRMIEGELSAKTRRKRGAAASAVISEWIEGGWEGLNGAAGLASEAARIVERVAASAEIDRKTADVIAHGGVAEFATGRALKDFRYYIGDIAKRNNEYRLLPAYNRFVNQINTSHTRTDDRLKAIFKDGLVRFGTYIESPANKELSDALADMMFYGENDQSMHKYQQIAGDETSLVNRKGSTLHKDAVAKIKRIASLKGAPYSFEQYMDFSKRVREELSGPTLENQKVNALIIFSEAMSKGSEDIEGNIRLFEQGADGLVPVSVGKMTKLAEELESKGRSAVEAELRKLKFGREAYWMSESDFLTPNTEDIFERAISAPARPSTPTVLAREGDTQPLKSVNFVRALDAHIRRADIASNAWRDGRELQSIVRGGKLDGESKDILEWMRKQVGTHQQTNAESKVGKAIAFGQSLFWIPYMINNAATYTARNLSLQPFMFAGVLPAGASTVSMGRMLHNITQKDSMVRQYYENNMRNAEIQGLQVVRESILMQDRFDSKGQKGAPERMERAGRASRAGVLAVEGAKQASAYIGFASDWASRVLAGATIYQYGLDKVSKLFDGRANSAGKVWSSLATNLMRAEEQAYLFNLFTKGYKQGEIGAFNEFLSEYARLKNLSVNFEYRTQGKSSVEQSGYAVRAGLGVFNYFKGNLQLLKTGGIEPIAEGFESGNYKQIASGLNFLGKNLTMKTISNIIPSILGMTSVVGMIWGDDDDDDKAIRTVSNSMIGSFGGFGAPIESVLDRVVTSTKPIMADVASGKVPSKKKTAKALSAIGPSVPALPYIARGIEDYFSVKGKRAGSEYSAFVEWVDQAVSGDKYEKMDEKDYNRLFEDHDYGWAERVWHAASGKNFGEIEEFSGVDNFQEVILATAQLYLNTARGYSVETIEKPKRPMGKAR